MNGAWMPKRYSQDLRDRVLAAYDEGMETTPIARLFKVSPAWARRVKQRRAQFGETTPRCSGGFKVIKVDRAQLAELVRANPDATLEELRERLGVQCAISTICMALKQLGFTLKKKSCGPRSRAGRMWRSVAWSGRTSRVMSMAAG
ncbi:MAG: helix-turn-helix domain-containing protein [Candidatus Acidiferrales bacterium]